MSETNKTYRIRTNVGQDDYLSVSTNLLQDYDAFDILSVSVNTTDMYRLHNSNYGIVVGRVLANNGFGIPNAKISVFIASDNDDDIELNSIYPFSYSTDKDDNGVRYNLLPDEKVGDCHQVVGTFPNKRYVLDNGILLEVFDKYYKYTTRTNNAGDYLICGVPVGNHVIHMDLDLSDCGILSQRPRDFVYKGYTIEQFENPNMFKEGTEYNNLSQVFTQDQSINVIPFWGNNSTGDELGITRVDINVNFRFEPTCVFLGSVASDNSSQGIAKGCVPTPHMGDMDELVTGEGKIEMIRKTPGGSVEEFQIRGTQLINGDGIWCYQIPMNLDYMMTDEYGNMVPTDSPDKGIPTRARVRFRLSMQDNEENTDNYFRPKVLIPHNPQNNVDETHEDYDYEFGSATREDSFRDLFWNNVYSVKSYIPRFQKRGSSRGWKEDRYSGIKGCNFYGPNNPIPYNNIRIKMPFMFKMMCLLVKTMVLAISIINSLISFIGNSLAWIAQFMHKLNVHGSANLFKQTTKMKLIVLEDGLCPDLENWYFAPLYVKNLKVRKRGMAGDGTSNDLYYNILYQTLKSVVGANEEESTDLVTDALNVTTPNDSRAIDTENADFEDETTCITVNTDYLMSCIEMNLAMEYKVIKFNFYNDWINGLIYIPRFMRYIRPKKKFLGITVARSKVRGCMDDPKIFAKNRRYTQQCAIGYKKGADNTFTLIKNEEDKDKKGNKLAYNNKYHKRFGFKQVKIFGKNGGICHEHPTLKKQFVYYLKPCEWPNKSGWLADNKKVNLFATDIILLGSLNNCDNNGLPQAFKYLSSTSYIMPTNLALTNMETNGPLYAFKDARGNRTMCMGSQNGNTTVYPSINIRRDDYVFPETAVTAAFPPVTDIMSGVTSALTEEIKYLQSSSSPNDSAYTETNELIDIIPMTIAAGISWNYTGPGQGKIHPEALYYPGGHFLGMSCKNSQTNIKSCLNLERICEIGATMSQRKEDVVGFENDGKTLAYAYSSPTGFISGEEIINTDFRTMFATMNSGRLLANKINPITGYKIYDFAYYRPSNFDGTFSQISDKYPEDYNYKRLVMDETATLKALLPNIADVSDRDDYDYNEVVNAQNRTRESTSLDYYLFRFGLTYADYVKASVQERKFLGKTGDNYYYLPQYENSFYFYFGMRNGATAIDEFNKQFFSECESTSLLGDNAGVDLSGTIDVCDATGTLTVSTRGLRLPLEVIDINGDTAYTETYSNRTAFSIEGLSFGDYVVAIKDATGVEVYNKIAIGGNYITADVEVFNFNVDPVDIPDRETYRGGYIEVSNVNVDGFDDTFEVCTLVVKDSGGTVVSSGNTELNSENIVRLYVNEEGGHTLYLKYKCSGHEVKEIEVKDFSVLGPASMDILVGDREKASIKSKLGNTIGNFWFDNIGDSASTEQWIYRVGFFNEINSANEGKETFDNKISTVNGDKVLWGYPQNNLRVLSTSGVMCSESDIPVGYTLDDENSYYSTYGVSGGSVVNYSAIVVNDEIVIGKYYGRLSGGTEIVSANDLKHYKVGYGYVFKPIPYGDLEYYVFDGTLRYSEGSTDGLFFPSVIYPVMKRPFFVNSDFFTWDSKDVVIEGTNVSEEHITKGIHSELEIHNGITFNNKFDINAECTINDEPVAIGVTNSDTYGLSSGASVDRLTAFVKDIELSDIGSASYQIKEGHPNGVTYSLMVNTISDTITATWAENFIYTMDDAGHISGATTFPYDGTGIDGVDYYYCSQGGPSNIEFIDTSEYIKREVENKETSVVNYYVLCRYTKFSFTEGTSVIATLRKDDNVWYCTYDGNTVTITPQGMQDIDEILDHLTEYVSDLVAEKRKTVLANPKINGVIKPWKDVVDACIVEKIEWNGATARPSTNTFNEDTFFIVGIVRQTPYTNPDGETVLYKVFPYVFKTSRIIH